MKFSRRTVFEVIRPEEPFLSVLRKSINIALRILGHRIVPRKAKSRARLRAIASAIVLCSFLSATPALIAQLQTLDISQYLHTAWNAQDGFFSGGIEAVTQTPDGYLWLTSTAGLLRFDGMRFVPWKPPAQESLPLSPLHSLLASKDGSLWIGGYGLAEITATGQFHRYHQLDDLEVAALAEDQDGAIWAGGSVSARHGRSPLCRVYRGQSECYGDGAFMGGYVLNLYQDQKSRLWAGTSDGVWRIRPGPPERAVRFSGHVRTFAEDAKGNLLFSDGAGNQVKELLNEGTIQNYPIFPDGKTVGAWKLFKDKEGSLWIGTLNSIVHVHEGRVDRFTTLDGLSPGYIQDIFQDKEGSIWVASTNALDRFTEPAVPRITTKQGLLDNWVFSVLIRHDGTTLIGTELGLDELRGNEVILSKAKRPNRAVTDLFETLRGRLLVTSNVTNSMVWLEGSKSVPLGVQSGTVIYDVAQDRQGDLWIVSAESGLLHLRADGALVEILSRSTLGLRAFAVAVDPRRDGLWLTSISGELFFLKDRKVVERYDSRDGLPLGALRDPQVDDDGAVWVSTRSGLARLMHGKIQILGRSNGLPCDVVHWMRHDMDRNVWLYTECGLVSFSDNELSSWIAQPSHILTIRTYLDNTEGVESVPNNGWYSPQTATTSDGRILFATNSGLAVLNPHDLHQNALPPPVYVEEVTVDGRPIQETGQAFLPKRPRTLHFAFTALSLMAPRKVRFRYKLEGYDKEWSEPVSVREATYTNLPPGDYQFRVIASNNDGVWNESGAHLAFTIPTAFSQSLWFKAICLLGLVALVYSVYRFRVRQVTLQLRARMFERLAERERIARDLHDTFFQGIQGLLLRFHTATSQLGNDVPARQIFEETLKQSDQVMLEGRELVLDLRATASEQNDLPTTLADFAEEMRKDCSCDFKVVVNGAIRLLHPVVFEELSKLGKEALGNAFRHSGAHSIEAELNYERSELRMRIRDDGTGIDSGILRQGHRDGHFGLPGMRERARKVGGYLDVWSRSGAGTEVELRIPARVAYVAEPNGHRFWRFWRRTNPGKGHVLN